jgi:hypothetical protein
MGCWIVAVSVKLSDSQQSRATPQNALLAASLPVPFLNQKQKVQTTPNAGPKN